MDGTTKSIWKGTTSNSNCRWMQFSLPPPHPTPTMFHSNPTLPRDTCGHHATSSMFCCSWHNELACLFKLPLNPVGTHPCPSYSYPWIPYCCVSTNTQTYQTTLLLPPYPLTILALAIILLFMNILPFKFPHKVSVFHSLTTPPPPSPSLLPTHFLLFTIYPVLHSMHCPQLNPNSPSCVYIMRTTDGHIVWWEVEALQECYYACMHARQLVWALMYALTYIYNS